MDTQRDDHGGRARQTSSCPACGYDLSGVRTDEEGLRCPECGRLSPARVPRLACPFECRRCGRDLVGSAIEGGMVVCPGCGREEKWPEEAPPGSEAWAAGAGRVALVLFLLVAFGITPAVLAWLVLRAVLK